jgi:hypothetical protein
MSEKKNGNHYPGFMVIGQPLKVTELQDTKAVFRREEGHLIVEFNVELSYLRLTPDLCEAFGRKLLEEAQALREEEKKPRA